MPMQIPTAMNCTQPFADQAHLERKDELVVTRLDPCVLWGRNGQWMITTMQDRPYEPQLYRASACLCP